MDETKQNSRRLEDEVEFASRELSRLGVHVQKAQEGLSTFEAFM